MDGAANTLPKESVWDYPRRSAAGKTVCEWKGTASYFDIAAGDRLAKSAAWSYRRPPEGYEQLAGCYAFYAGRVDAAYLDDEPVTPQPGGFYGGWITAEIDGPFKGEPGSERW